MNYLPEPGSVDSGPLPGVMRRVRRAIAPTYRVGELFYRGRRDWPAKAEFAFGPAGHELTLFHPAIKPDLIDDVRRGPAEFALIVRQPVIVLAYRFGDAISWEDAPYSWHLQPEFRRHRAAVARRIGRRMGVAGERRESAVVHARGDQRTDLSGRLRAARRCDQGSNPRQVMEAERR